MTNEAIGGLSVLGSLVWIGSFTAWLLLKILDPWEAGDGVRWWRLVVLWVAPLAWLAILIRLAIRGLVILIRHLRAFVRENRRRLRGVPPTPPPPRTGVYR